jgi:basic amino acid/polyamine antiporter, APA family
MSQITEPQKLRRHLGLFDATTIVAGSMIGSAIFFGLSIMAGYVMTPGILIGLWIIGGVFTVLGAISCSELAAMFPHSGGQYVYLREAFGDFWAFLFGWGQFLVIQTGTIAAVAIAFAKYLGSFVPELGEATVLTVVPLGQLFLPEAWQAHLPAFLLRVELNSAQLVACAVIAFLTGINIWGVRQGAFVQNLFTVLKVAALVALIAVGLSHVHDTSNFFPLVKPIQGHEALQMGLLAAMAVALSKALFAYDAWYTVAFVAEEVRDTDRTLPRAMVIGTLLVTVLYVLTNLAYLAILPVGEIAGIEENRVAQQVAEVMFGNVGWILVIMAILISTFGCVNGLILGGARVFYAMAREGLFFRRCADLHPKARTPGTALIFQGVWSMALTLTGSYSDLLTYTMFMAVLFGALTIAAVYKLRISQPDRPRPYRCWGYPVTPAIYLAISVVFLIGVAQGAWFSTVAGIALMLSGIPFYIYWKKRRSII